MKYNLCGFSQSVAISLKLNSDDLIFLRWIHDFISSGKISTIHIDSIPFYWIYHKTVCQELPIIFTSKKKVQRTFTRLSNLNICSEMVIAEHGNKTYYAFNSSILNSVDTTGVWTKVSIGGKTELSIGYGQKCPDIDSSISDSSTNKTLPQHSTENGISRCVSSGNLLEYHKENYEPNETITALYTRAYQIHFGKKHRAIKKTIHWHREHFITTEQAILTGFIDYFRETEDRKRCYIDYASMFVDWKDYIA